MRCVAIEKSIKFRNFSGRRTLLIVGALTSETGFLAIFLVTQPKIRRNPVSPLCVRLKTLLNVIKLNKS